MKSSLKLLVVVLLLSSVLGCVEKKELEPISNTTSSLIIVSTSARPTTSTLPSTTSVPTTLMPSDILLDCNEYCTEKGHVNGSCVRTIQMCSSLGGVNYAKADKYCEYNPPLETCCCIKE
ncbi:hypothetical protein ACFLRC_00865 [Candidatus Altiarchaeota archaeon]